MAKTELGPDEVRALRGTLSRADFARKVGVTPLTVYRWELPDDAPESRRPRGAVAERLRRVVTREPARAPEPARAVAANAEPAIDPDDAAAVLPALDRVLRGEFARADDDLVHLLVSGALRSVAGRATAQATLALGQVLARQEPRVAFTTVQPALRDADAELLPPAAELVVRTAAALVFSSADGRLFDAGRANAQIARGERIAGRGASPDLVFLLRFAGAVAGFYAGTAGRAATQNARDLLFEVIDAVNEPVTRLLADEIRAHVAMSAGQTAQVARRFYDVAEHAAKVGFASLEARALAFCALRQTSESVAPDIILAVAERSKEVATRARLGPGLCGVFAAKAAGEALLRLGRFAEAERELALGVAAAQAMAWSPIPLVMPFVRLFEHTGRLDRMLHLGEELVRIGRPVVQALGEAVIASHAAIHGDTSDRLARAEQRLEQTDPNPFLLQEVLVHGISARLPCFAPSDVRVAVRRVQRIVDRYPSAMSGGLLKRHLALLACREGRLAEAVPLLEASIATFTLAGDRVEAANGRHWLARIVYELEESGAEQRIADSAKEIEALGMAPFPSTIAFGTFDAAAPPSAATLSRGASPRAEGMAVAIERIGVRGVSPSMLREEVVAVVAEMFPGRGVLLDEIGVSGDVRTVAERGDTSAPPEQWFELGDGLGARLRLGLAGPLPDGAYEPLAVVASVASLALEVASLRAVPEDAAEAVDVDVPELAGFVAASASMRRLRSEIARLGQSRATVILEGESGTGKEVVARAIHDLSARAKGPYVTFNCAAVPRELFEGQLFGYKRGAFTGALADHPGVIRAANGGTLFLDEIGELPLELQAKLLRFLENREILPLGEPRAIEVDVRTIAATHQDLAQRVREGKFREDLYYRLQVVPLAIPPLRERPEDVIALARHFVRTLTPPGQEPPTIAPDALGRLASYAWPGNVRELRNAIERALAFAPLPRVLTPSHLRVGEGTLRPPRA